MKWKRRMEEMQEMKYVSIELKNTRIAKAKKELMNTRIELKNTRTEEYERWWMQELKNERMWFEECKIWGIVECKKLS